MQSGIDCQLIEIWHSKIILNSKVYGKVTKGALQLTSPPQPSNVEPNMATNPSDSIWLANLLNQDNKKLLSPQTSSLITWNSQLSIAKVLNKRNIFLLILKACFLMLGCNHKIAIGSHTIVGICSSDSIPSSAVPLLDSLIPFSALTWHAEAAFKTCNYKCHPELVVDSICETVVIVSKSCSKNCCQWLHDSSDIHSLNLGMFSERFTWSNLERLGTDSEGLLSGRCYQVEKYLHNYVTVHNLRKLCSYISNDYT